MDTQHSLVPFAGRYGAVSRRPQALVFRQRANVVPTVHLRRLRRQHEPLQIVRKLQQVLHVRHHNDDHQSHRFLLHFRSAQAPPPTVALLAQNPYSLLLLVLFVLFFFLVLFPDLTCVTRHFAASLPHPPFAC